MTGNVLWCALTNTRRKRAASVLLFVLSLLIAGSLFLVIVAARYLGIPDLTAIGRFFPALLILVSAADAVVIFAIALFFAHSRRREIGIYRIHGASMTDILFLNAVEMLLVSFSGSFAGVLLGLSTIASGLYDLPGFFKGAKGLMVIGTGGQIAFGIPIIEIAVASAVTGRFLKECGAGHLRGSC